MMTAGSLDLRARDYVAKIEDDELRQKAEPFIDATIIMRASDKKDPDRLLEMVRIGNLTHFQKAWALTQAARFLAKGDGETSVSLRDVARTEARRIETAAPGRPRATPAGAKRPF